MTKPECQMPNFSQQAGTFGNSALFAMALKPERATLPAP